MKKEKTNEMQQSDVYVGHCPTTATNRIQQNQRSTPYAVTHSLCSPENGHNDAQNMLRQKLIINI